MPPSWTALHNLGSISSEFAAGGHHISAVVGPMAGSGEPMEDSNSLSPAPGSLDEEALKMGTPEGSWPPSSSSPAFDGKCQHLCTSLYLGTRLTWEGVDLMGQA